MVQYWSWRDQSSRQGKQPLLPVARAGLAHIWFESIHPYEDGNGRIGRAISEKLLAQGLPTPAVTTMAGTLLLHRKAYYAALERAHTDLDITDWLLWFAAKAIEAQRRTLQLVEFVLEKARLLDRLRGQLNERQEKVLLRLFEAGPGGFGGGLSASNYMAISGAPPATTTRDLGALVAQGALLRSGEQKSTRYRLRIEVDAVSSVEVADII
jgi:Fic family protein